MMEKRFPLVRRVLAGGAVVGIGTVVFALPASAHIEIENGPQEAGSYAVLSFAVPHGCEESPTTKIRIQLPESIPDVTPQVNAGWDIELVTESLAEPIDQEEGDAITERVTEVDFTAKVPLSPHFRDVLQLSLRIPEDAAGTSLVFPVIQECSEGRTDWTQIPAAGQDEEELAHPAPSVDVVAAGATGDAPGDGDGHHDDGGDAADASGTDGDADSSAPETSGDSGGDDDSGSAQGIAIAGLVTGVLGMAFGGRALAASKQRD